MTFWFHRKIESGRKITKCISIRFLPQHWKLIHCKSNGALKGRKEDTCYDFNIHFLGIFFSYTNWDYNYKIN